jgi:hypothetical protein
MVRFASPPLVLDTGCVLSLEGFPSCVAALESSPDAAAWTAGATVTLGADGRAEATLPPAGAAHFFRLRR